MIRAKPTTSARGPRGCLSNIAPKVILLLVTIFVLFAIGEIAVRMLTEIGPQLAVRDPVLGKRYVKNYDDRVFVPEGGKTVGLRFNREGFRGPDFPYGRVEGTRRVAVIGDSMTVLVATEEERTWVSTLERMLSEHSSDDRWKVLNFGVSSASTGQELVLYREVVSLYEPDIVILALFVGNDVTDNSRLLTRAPRIYFDLADDGGVRRASNAVPISAPSTWLNRHSRLYVWYRTVSTISKARVRLARNRLETRHLIFRTDDPGDVAHAWDLTERLIRTFAAEVEANGSRFLLAVLPTGPQLYPDLWAEILAAAGDDSSHFDPEYPERRILSFCEAEGIACLTLLESLRAVADKDAVGDDRLFYDNGRRHFNDEGNRLAAEIIYDFLGSGIDLRSEP